MSIVKLDEYRANRQAGMAGVEGLDDLSADLPAENATDMALQLADAQSRISELELVLVETLKRNAMNWARAQDAEAKLEAMRAKS